MALVDLIDICLNYKSINYANLRQYWFNQILTILEEKEGPLPLDDLQSVRDVMAHEAHEEDLEKFDRLIRDRMRKPSLISLLEAIPLPVPYESFDEKKGGSTPPPPPPPPTRKRKRKRRGHSGRHPTKRAKTIQAEKRIAEKANEPEHGHNEGPNNNSNEHQAAEAGPVFPRRSLRIHRNHRGNQASGTGEKKSHDSPLLLSPSSSPRRKGANKEPDTNDAVDVDFHHVGPLVPDEPLTDRKPPSPIGTPTHDTEPSPAGPHFVTPSHEPPNAQHPQSPTKLPRLQSVPCHPELELVKVSLDEAAKVMMQTINAALVSYHHTVLKILAIVARERQM